jgi:hypothetical protein
MDRSGERKIGGKKERQGKRKGDSVKDRKETGKRNRKRRKG